MKQIKVVSGTLKEWNRGRRTNIRVRHNRVIEKRFRQTARLAVNEGLQDEYEELFYVVFDDASDDDMYDDSDCCKGCEDIFSAAEVRHYRDECNGADDCGMPTYCQRCLDRMHTCESTNSVTEILNILNI